jgi:hypothetical protein
VNKVVPREELMDTAMDFAKRIAGNAPLVLGMLKRWASEMMPKGPLEHADSAGSRRRSSRAAMPARGSPPFARSGSRNSWGPDANQDFGYPRRFKSNAISSRIAGSSMVGGTL